MKQHQSDCQENKSGKITVDFDVLCTLKCCNINLAHTLTVTLRPRRAATKNPFTIGSEKPCTRGVNAHYKITYSVYIYKSLKSLASATCLLYTQTKQTVYHSHVLIQDPANGCCKGWFHCPCVSMTWKKATDKKFKFCCTLCIDP